LRNGALHHDVFFMPTELIVIRHGVTHWNLQGRVQGLTDIELHPDGIRQAQALAERLAQTTVHSVYSSDLKRAYQTAQWIAQRHNLPITPHPGLRERSFGIWEGLTVTEIETQYPEEWRRFRGEDPDFIVPQGVCLRQFGVASIVCLEAIAARHVGERVVVVTHGGVIKALLRHTLNLSVTTGYRQENTAVNVFSFENAQWRLDVCGDTSHLASSG